MTPAPACPCRRFIEGRIGCAPLPTPPDAAPEPRAAPIPAAARSTELAPPAEMQPEYWKTRVERVLRRRVVVSGGSSRTIQLTLGDDTMMRGVGLDPRAGTLWLRIGASLGELSARIKVYWLIPGGAESYLYLDQPLTLGDVNEVPLWRGPIPGPVAFEIILTNTGTSATFRLVADVVAKRSGGNFDHGTWLLVADPKVRLATLPPFEPPEEEPPVLARRSCGARPSVPFVRPPDIATLNELRRDRARKAARLPSNPLAVEDEPADPVDDEREACVGTADDPRDIEIGLRDRVPSGQAGGSVAYDVAESAWDWAERFTSPFEWVPDPEVEHYVAAPLSIVAGGGTRIQMSASANRLGIGLDFPDGFPELQHRVGVPLIDYLGRLQGFDELWEDVTQGLEKDRMSQARLTLILTTIPLLPGSSGWASVNALVRPRSAGDSWDWGITAPWLQSEALLRDTWYMMSLLNLMSCTSDLLPREIVTYRYKGRFPWTRRGCKEDRSKCRTHSISRSQARWRIGESVSMPFWKLFAGERERTYQGYSQGFRLNSLDWNSNLWNTTFASWWDNKKGRALATTVWLPVPVPSLVTFNTWTWLPFADAASQLYSAARLFTMAAMEIQTAGGDNNQVLDDARKLYRAYLTCLAIPGKTLWHEMYHTVPTPVYNALSVAVWLFDIAMNAPHCSSGCGQEKMGTSWFAHLGWQTAFYPVSLDLSRVQHAPQSFDDKWPTGPVFAIKCFKHDGVLFGVSSSFTDWPDTPAKAPAAVAKDEVVMAWKGVKDTQGSSQKKFRKKCFGFNETVKYP